MKYQTPEENIIHLQGQIHALQALVLGLANLTTDRDEFRAEGVRRIETQRAVIVGRPVPDALLAGIDAIESWLLSATDPS